MEGSQLFVLGGHTEGWPEGIPENAPEEFPKSRDFAALGTPTIYAI
jgi:hypothetical protein